MLILPPAMASDLNLTDVRLLMGEGQGVGPYKIANLNIQQYSANKAVECELP